MKKWPFQIKSAEEILEKCQELVRRHRRRFLQRNLKPCPFNCKSADIVSGREVIGCSGCSSQSAKTCLNAALFQPLFSKEELINQFAEQLRNPQTLLRSYRDLVSFFWCLGVFSDPQTLNAEAIKVIDTPVKAISKSV